MDPRRPTWGHGDDLTAADRRHRMILLGWVLCEVHVNVLPSSGWQLSVLAVLIQRQGHHHHHIICGGGFKKEQACGCILIRQPSLGSRISKMNVGDAPA